MSRASILGTLGLSGFNSLGNVLVSQGSTSLPAFSAANTLAGLGVNSIAALETSNSMQLKRIDAQTSNRVVTLSAVPGACDIQAADWTTGNHITNWSTLQSYLSAVAYSNRNISPSAVYMEVFATNAYPSIGGAQNWEGGVLAPNGKIYCFPENATVALIIDPVTNTVTTFGGGSFPIGGTARYQGGVLATNGKIYGVPCGGGTHQSVFQLIDPSNNTITAYASLASLPISNAFQGGVLAPNGKIYLVPSDNSVFCLIDPSNNTVTTFATYAKATNYEYAKGCLGPNGKVYIAPYGATVGRVIDPNNNTITTYGALGGPTGVSGAILAPNGKIYFTPNNSIGYIVDPLNNNAVSTYSCAPAITGVISSFGGALAPNGKIYFTSWVGTFLGMIDPDNNTVTRIGTVPSLGYLDIVVTPNGKLVFIPAAATSITAYNLKLNNNWDMNVSTNPMFNKN